MIEIENFIYLILFLMDMEFYAKNFCGKQTNIKKAYRFLNKIAGKKSYLLELLLVLSMKTPKGKKETHVICHENIEKIFILFFFACLRTVVYVCLTEYPRSYIVVKILEIFFFTKEKGMKTLI